MNRLSARHLTSSESTAIRIADSFRTSRFGFRFALLLALGVQQGYAALDTNLTGYTWSASRAAFVALEEQARDATKRKEVEATLTGLLGDPSATFEAKQYACRILRATGTDASVPAVAALLTDEKLSHFARFALEGNSSTAAADALRDALGKVSGALKAGMINSLGARRDAKSVPAIAALTGDANADIAVAALDALGRIATREAAGALVDSKPAAALLRNKQNALVECADRLVGAGDKKTARPIFADLADNGGSALVKLAGVRGLARCGEADRVLALLEGQDAAMQAGAAQIAGELPEASDAKAVAKKLSSFPPAVQAAVITGLSRRGDKAGAAEVAALIASATPEVKLAAIEATGIIGSDDDVPALLQAAAGADDAAKAAVAALQVLPGRAASKAIAMNLSAEKSPAQRAQAAEILGVRQARSEVGALLALLDDADESVRNAAGKALRNVAGPDEIKPLVSRLKAATDAATAGRLQAVLLAAVERSPDAGGVAKQLLPALQGGDEAKKGVLPVLSRVGGPAAVAAVQEQIAAGGAIHRDAVRALADWRSDEALAPLLDVAAKDADDAAKILALRGYIRIVADQKDRKVAEASKLIGDALAVATRDEERTAALAGLGQSKGIEPVKIAATYLNQPNLAAAAALAISQSAKDVNPKDGKRILAEVKKAREAAKDPKLQKELDGLIQKFSK